MITRHVCFNPMFTASLQPMLDDHERAGWTLLRVVQSTPYEAVAVFVRDPEEAKQ